MQQFLSSSTVLTEEPKKKPALNEQEPPANPWEGEVSNVDMPEFLPLVKADKEMMETLDNFKNDPKVVMHFQPNDETDYVCHRFNDKGKLEPIRVCKVVNINGVQYYIMPGRNTVPKTVYEFLMQMDSMKARVKILPNQARCIGEI